MSSQKKKVQCSRFEPQAWRKTLCKNCFKTKNEHTEGAMEESQTSDYMSDGASSPEVLMGDKVIIRRNIRTPPPDCQTGDFVGLGRRGSDGGRLTPTLEERGRSASTEKATEAGFRNEGKRNEEIIHPDSPGSIGPPTSKDSPSPVDAKRDPSFRPTEQKHSTEEPGRSSVQETSDGQGSSRDNPSPDVRRTLPSSPPSPSCEVAKASDGGDVAPGGKAGTSGVEIERSVQKTEEKRGLDTEETDKKAEIQLNMTTDIESSLPINNEENQSLRRGSDEGRGSEGSAADLQSSKSTAVATASATTTATAAAAAATAADLGADNVDRRILSTCDGKSTLKSEADRNAAAVNSQSINSSSCRQQQQQLGSTKIAQETEDAVESSGSSYVQSLRISLSSPVPVNTGAQDSRNSYGARHTGEPLQPPPTAATAAAASTAGPGEAVSEGGGGGSSRDRLPEESSRVDDGISKSSATAIVTQFQLANPTNSRDLSSEESLSHEGRPFGLNLSDRTVGSKSCVSSPPPPPGSPAGREETGVCLASESVAPSYDNNSSRPASQSTSGYQYVDADDSRVCYNIVDDGSGVKTNEENLYYLSDGARDNTPGSGAIGQEAADRSLRGSELSTDEPRRKVTSLFHHVPGDSNGYADESQSCTTSGESDQYRNQGDSSSNNSQQQPGSGRRRRRSRVISLEDDLGPRSMNAYDYGRSDAMMEGTRIVMESLREKVALLQDQIERQEREKSALGDLLSAKKSDYEMMKDHYNNAIGNLDMEVQRLKSEKSRLLDKLQLPESERASLAAEENEIAELKRRLEEYENRYTEVVGENEDLRQEVRDLQLEMEEMHDQFREEETIEFRELQKELENTAKNCRILQFKLRKSDRRIEQLESDRAQYEDKLRHYESCFQTSDDKRRIRVLEEDLRLARESAVRLHAEVERAEERRLKHQEELDRAKNSVNEADNKRLCLQNQLDSMKHEMGKLRDQLRFDTRQDIFKTGIHKISSSENDATVAQLTKDLKDSLERENDLKEQLKFSEEESVTMRKKLLEMEEETESMSLQLRKLSTAKSGRYTKGKVGETDNELLTERESEIRLQMELAEQEVKVLKRKMDELQQDNDNLLCAIKYLRSKLEQRDGVRSATPIGEVKNTKELLTRLGAPGPDESGEAESEVKDEVVEQLKACQTEVHRLKERIAELEMVNAKLLDDCKMFHSAGGGSSVITTSDELRDKEKNLMMTIEELEQLLMQEKEKVLHLSNEKQTTELNLNQEKSLIAEELSVAKEALVRVTQELEMIKKDLEQNKNEAQDSNIISSEKKTDVDMNKTLESATKELSDCKDELKRNAEELKKTKADLERSEKELNAVKKELATASDEKAKIKDSTTSDMKSKLEALQKTVSDLQSENDKLREKEKSRSSLSVTKEKEPASWRWEKQDLEKQAKEFKKKFEDLQAEMKKLTSKTKDIVKEESNDRSKQTEEIEQYKKQLDELKKKLSHTEKEKEKIEKEMKEAADKVVKEKTDISKTKDLFSKQKDDITEEKKKLMKDLETEKKKNEELTKEKERITKEKIEWISERKMLVQERDAAIKEKEELAKAKTGKDDDISKKSTPFGLRSKVGIMGKTTDSDASDSAKVKELMQTLEKKEAELQTLRTKAETKGPSEKFGFQAKEASDLKKDKEKLEKELEKLKEKLKSNEDVWLKEKTQLEQDLKQATDKSRSTAKAFRTPEDPKAVQEKEALIKEKLKLIEEVTKLKKELGDLDKQRNSDKEEFEKKLKDKTKSVDESKAKSDELKKEIERLKAQVESANSGPSKAITIPVQQDRSAKSIPIQKVSKPSSNSCDEQDPALIKAELIALEETYRSRTKNLEEELSSLREQLLSVQKESKTQSQKSQKSFAELKTNFEKEFNSWHKDKELLKKSGKLADENAAKMSKLDKTIEELNGKLKAEEAKRRELEVKLAAQENAAKVDKTDAVPEEKSKAQEEKSATGQKTSEFRNRFEKFGGTPRPVRKLSLPSTSTSLSDTVDKSDWVGEIQRQMTEAEKARLKDREELLEKLERQKKDFELKLEAFKETTKMLDAKSQDLSALEKKMVELHCQLEEERSSWAEERSKLQSKLTEAQKSGRDAKDKVAELSGEVKKLQVLASSGKSGSLSGTSAPLASSTTAGTEKPSFKVKSQGSDSTQNSTPSPATSIVIPVRKVDDVKKPQTEDAAQPSTPTSNGVGKLSKKLFPPFATDSTQNSSSSTKSYMPGQRTPIPINRINRSNPPKL